MWLTAGSPFLFSLSLWAGLLTYLRWEHRRHVRSREKIRLRIHVNGTRGKSSVTRLIAAGLRSGGFTVFAKTTGTSPRLIRPDGSEEPLKRRGPANIRENLEVIRRAARAGADAVVVECMALRPDLQGALEHRILKSHVGVITNIRPDHEDVMGSGVAAVARALSQTIPSGGTLVTTRGSVGKLREAGVAVPEPRLRFASDKLSSEELAAFPYEVFPENIALALAVCECCGVARAAALEGMQRAEPDEGTVRAYRFSTDGTTVHFINAFAANDPESTLLLWQRYVEKDAGPVVVLLNTRADRKYRTQQLCRMLGAIHRGPFLVTGETWLVKRLLRPFTGIEILSVGRADCFRVLQQTIGKMRPPFVQVFAAGNRQGMEPLLEFIAALEHKSGAA